MIFGAGRHKEQREQKAFYASSNNSVTAETRLRCDSMTVVHWLTVACQTQVAACDGPQCITSGRNRNDRLGLGISLLNWAGFVALWVVLLET